MKWLVGGEGGAPLQATSGYLYFGIPNSRMCELGDSELLAKGGVQVFKPWVFLVLCVSLSNLFFINTLQNLLGLGGRGTIQDE